MTLVTPQPRFDLDDGPAIAELHRVFAVRRAAHLADPYPSALTRRVNVRTVQGALPSLGFGGIGHSGTGPAHV